MDLMRPLSDRLDALHACDESVEWAATQTDDAQAWQSCERGDWMLWIAAQSGVDRRVAHAAACACARLSLVHVPAGEVRPLRCIEVTEAWCRGEATKGQVREARRAAVTAYGTYVAACATAAAAAATAAAYAATYATTHGAAAARSATLRQCASLVRERISYDVIAAAMSVRRQ